MEPNFKEEQERIVKAVADLKSIQIDYFFKNNYCDVLEDKKWIVAEILDRNDDKVKIHYEGWSNKQDEYLLISKRRIAHFRKYSKAYTGQMKKETRDYTFSIDEANEIKTLLKSIQEKQFSLEPFDNPLDVTQTLRGKIFYAFDYIFTTHLEKPAEEIPSILELIYKYLDFVTFYLQYLKDNLPLCEVVEKNYEMYLIDKKTAIIASYFEIINTLQKIFMSDSRTNYFFTEYKSILDSLSSSSDLKINQTGEKICFEGCYSVESSERPIVIANFVDYFYNSQGIHLLFENIFAQFTSFYSSSVIGTPLYIINTLLSVLNHIYPYVDIPSRFSKELIQFKEFIFHKIQNFTEAEIKEIDRSIIDDISQTIKVIYHSQQSGELSLQLAEEFKLTHSYKCFMSKILEKRIKGIAYINKIADCLNNPSQDKTSADLQWINLNLGYFFTWLEERNLIAEILGENIHEEILKRSQNIFEFLVKNNHMPSEVYHQLWKCVLKEHEIISNEIKKLLIELSLVMKEEDKIFLFNMISEFPLDYDSSGSFLKFIQNMTINCLKNCKASANVYGIPLLWNFMQDDFNTSITVDMAYECLKEIFTNSNISIGEVTKYMTLCIQNVQKATSVVQSMKLFKILCGEIAQEEIDGYAIENKEACENILTMLNDEYSLVEIFVQDTQRYMAKAMHMHIQSQEKSAEDYRNQIFEGAYGHWINVDIRLKNILFLFSYADSLKFTSDHILRLWTVFMVQGKAEIDRSLFCHFLSRMESEANYCNDSTEQIQDVIFTQILLNSELNPPDSINYLGFFLLKNFFFLINGREMNLIKLGKSFRITSVDLLGFSNLWDILILCKNENVRKESSKLLVDIYLNPKLSDEDFCCQFWNIFTSKLTSSLQNCVEQKFENGIKGLLLVIKQLISKLSCEGEVSKSEDIKHYPNSVPVTFFFSEKNVKKEIKISQATEFVYEVRDKISVEFDIPLQSVVLESKSNVIDTKVDEKFFREVADLQCQVEVFKRGNPIYNFSNINPKVLIMESKFIFDTLFELLENSGSSFIDEVLDVINMIPWSGELEASISALGNEMVIDSNKPSNISKYLCSTSLYKLQYSLQIIKKLCESNAQWTENFRVNGAVAQLIAVINQFQSANFTQNSILWFKCLNDIFIILKRIEEVYLTFHSDKFIECEDIKSQLSILLRNLFEIILFIFKSSYLKDLDPKLKELQAEHTKKRTKEFVRKIVSIKDDNNLPTELIIDSIHEKIRDIWQSEFNTMNLIFKFLQQFPTEDIFTHCFFNKTFQELMTWGLIFPKNSIIKASLFDNISKIVINSQHNQRISEFYCMIFNTMLNEDVMKLCIENPSESEQFFRILKIFFTKCKITTTFIEENRDKLKIDFLEVVKYMLSYISCQGNSTSLTDNVMVGFLTLLKEMVCSNRTIYTYAHDCGLFDLLIHKCLFTKCKISADENAKPICDTPQSRSAAFKLLTVISANIPDYIHNIIDIILDFYKLGYWRTQKLIDWNITPPEVKSLTGFTGLKNLGCTCYMNSLLQQLFMIPTLREGILSTTDSDTHSKNESVLFHLKYIFGSLKATDRQYHIPSHFTSIFTNYDGQVMKVTEQMDVDEFFNLLIDRLEPYLKVTSFENIIKYHFSGIMSNELICKGCPHYSERKEPFNSISLQVKNKKSLLESLSALVQGEMLMGDNAYFCEKCEKKVTTLRRQCIKKLPQVLVIVLKRFEFDYDKMAKIKVNDYCEFPMELDMENYTQDYLSKKEAKGFDDQEDKKYITGKNKYDLTGFIIHTGTAESGHYYSIIKSRDKWLEFNDTQVAEYDLNDLKGEAFGGEPTLTQLTTLSGEKKSIMAEKSTNAYVLFYTKKYQENEEESLVDAGDDIPIDANSEIKALKEKEITTTSNIQSEIMDMIKLDNYKYWVGRIIFTKEYSEFVQDIMVNHNTDRSQMYKTLMVTKNLNCNVFPLRRKDPFVINLNIPDSFFISTEVIQSDDTHALISTEFTSQMFKFLAFFFYIAAIRSKDRTSLPMLCDIMKANINFSEANAIWILEEFSNHEILSEFLVDGLLSEMKKHCVGLIYAAMIKIYSAFSQETRELLACADMEFAQQNPLTNFIQVILFLLSKKHKVYIKKDFTFLYLIVYRFSLLGLHARQFLLNLNCVQFIISFLSVKYNLALLTNNQFNLEGMIKLQAREPSHKDLNEKTMYEPEKSSILMELFEKKIMEKNLPPDSYLLILLCEVIRGSDLRPITLKNPFRFAVEDNYNYNYNYLLKLPDNSRNSLNFSDFQLLRILLNECKSRLCVLYLSKLFAYVCYDDSEISTAVGNAMCDLMNLWDFENSGFLVNLFAKFLTIDDSLRETRLTIFLSKYFGILMDNLKYYKSTEFHIEFFIKFYSKYFDILEPFIDAHKCSIEKLIQWLKDNPIPPQFFPSKTTQYFKKKNLDYTKVKFNILTYPQCNNTTLLYQIGVINYSKTTENYQEKLASILQKKRNQWEEDNGEEEDLTDFKFSLKDVVRYSNCDCIARGVLDEMILIEYGGEKKNQAPEWIDTSSQMRIVELHGEDLGDSHSH